MPFDANSLILITLCAWSISVWLRLLRGRAARRQAGWGALAALLLVATLVGWRFWPLRAGYVLLGPFVLFAMLPVALLRRASRMVLERRYTAAARWARGAAWLHPFDEYPMQARVLAALRDTQCGDDAPAEALLQELGAEVGPAAEHTVLFLRQCLGQWQALRESLERHPASQAGTTPTSTDLALVAHRVRALCEVGEVRAALATFAHCETTMQRAGYLQLRQQVGLVLLAFGGRPRAVARLVAQLGARDGAFGRFWCATARLAAGEAGVAAELEALAAQTDDHALRRAIRHRLEAPPPTAALTPEEQLLLDALERETQHHERYGHGAASRPTPWATRALALAIVAGVALAAHGGGTTDLVTLWRLGALDPTTVFAGQPWRALSALFLHYGGLHAGLNLLALLYFGPFLEAHLGRARFLLCYLAAGIGSMLLTALAMRWYWLQPGLLVGASGAIMGLVGATAAVLLRGWHDGGWVARRRLAGIALIVVTQVVFDRLIPQVSGTAHLAGLVLGFALGLLPPRALPAQQPGE
ncbi:MAG: rhomboid family intramembrane serine protease [Proteobacteria bacterium]|nr:rhomboid family intramembrane serine protease [Pseudomonadota bacterium]